MISAGKRKPRYGLGVVLIPETLPQTRTLANLTVPIEDSPTGAQAALAAGTHLIAWPEDRTLEFPPGIRPITELEPAVQELLRSAA